MSDLRKWQKIGKFSDAATHARRSGLGQVEYVGTVKLHGTNAGVRRTPDGHLQPQSRNQKVNDGHFGFWLFVRQREDDINFLIDHTLTINNLPKDTDVTLFGEFIGPGVQKGVAISRLPEKQWVIFGARVTETGEQLEPSQVELPEQNIYSILLVPHFVRTVDFAQSLKDVAADMEGLTEAIDEKCPWGARFGIDGPGEGIVWRPISAPLKHDSELWFKTKGEKHQGKGGGARVKVKDSPSLSPDVLSFVDEHLTERRLEQGLEALVEQGRPKSMRSTKSFLDAVLTDLKAETENERVASGLEWQPIGSAAAKRAVDWFKQQLNND